MRNGLAAILCGMVWCAAYACSDPDHPPTMTSGPTDESFGTPQGPPATSAADGGGEDAADGGECTSGRDAVIQACQDYCAAAVPCGVEDSGCATHCEQMILPWNCECMELKQQEFDCTATLACTDLEAYVDDMRADPTCGAIRTQFAETCFDNAGTPPATCDDYCTAADSCSPGSLAAPLGCADACAEYMTINHLANGQDCLDTLLALYGCFSDLDCPTLQAMIEGGVGPDQCAGFSDLSSCQ